MARWFRVLNALIRPKYYFGKARREIFEQQLFLWALDNAITERSQERCLNEAEFALRTKTRNSLIKCASVLNQINELEAIHPLIWRKREKTDVFHRSLLLDLFLPVAIAEDAQASLTDMWAIWKRSHGRVRANWIRRAQVARIIIGHHAIPIAEFCLQVVRAVGSRFGG